MKRLKIGIAASLMCVCVAAAAVEKEKRWITGGVDIGAVDWATLCPAVAAVSITRDGVTCAVVHPASTVFRHPVVYFGAVPKLTDESCTAAAKEFKQWTSADADDAAQPWATCRFAFDRALGLRSREKFDDMPLDKWRAKYFSKYIRGVAK